MKLKTALRIIYGIAGTILTAMTLWFWKTSIDILLQFDKLDTMTFLTLLSWFLLSVLTIWVLFYYFYKKAIYG